MQMGKPEPGLYDFVFRGMLAEQALDRSGRIPAAIGSSDSPELAVAVGLDVLDDLLVVAARRMSVVYTAVAAWENAARKMVMTALVEQAGEDWWESCVPEKIRRRAESRRAEEDTIRWHGNRGQSLMQYTELSDLESIIKTNWEVFEPYFRSQDWVASIVGSLERSRNVIMHSGELDAEDIERIGMHVRDWVRQVGS